MEITDMTITSYEQYLIEEEKSSATLKKYIHDVRVFSSWLGNRELSKKAVLEYKQKLANEKTTTSINSALSSLNSFFEFNGWHDLRAKMLKIQKQIFISRQKELSKTEYQRLLNAAKNLKNQRLYYLMQTVCATGIRISELRYITVEAVGCGQAEINCKGKMRIVILPKQLCRMLNKYIKRNKIEGGAVFVTKNGNPLDRSNIWSDMKKLCDAAGVEKNKVFPHNLRHLFARTYYSLEKDIVRLADILGHSSVNTTRIYTMETGEIHRRQIQKLGLLQC